MRHRATKRIYKSTCPLNRPIKLIHWPLFTIVPLFILLLHSPLFAESSLDREHAISDTEVKDENREQQGAVTETSAQYQHEDLPETGNHIADKIHDTLSLNVSKAAQWLDSFFDDERIVDEENKTKVRLKLSAFTEEGENVDVSAKANISLVLPHTEKRLRLIVAGDPDEDYDFDNTITEDIGEDFERTDERNTSLGLQYTLKETLQGQLKAGIGLRFHSGSPVPILSTRYRQDFDVGTWLGRFTETLRWYTDKGLESKTRMDFERPVSEKFYFRTTARWIWYEDEDGYFYDVSCNLYQTLSRKKVLRYQWINSFRTEPNHYLDEIILRIRYRQQIWRKWFFYEIAPQLSFPRQNDYDVTPGILFKAEVIIGE